MVSLMIFIFYAITIVGLSFFLNSAQRRPLNVGICLRLFIFEFYELVYGTRYGGRIEMWRQLCKF